MAVSGTLRYADKHLNDLNTLNAVSECNSEKNIYSVRLRKKVKCQKLFANFEIPRQPTCFETKFICCEIIYTFSALL